MKARTCEVSSSDAQCLWHNSESRVHGRTYTFFPFKCLSLSDMKCKNQLLKSKEEKKGRSNQYAKYFEIKLMLQ